MSKKFDIMSGKSDMIPQKQPGPISKREGRGVWEDNLIGKQEEGGSSTRFGRMLRETGGFERKGSAGRRKRSLSATAPSGHLTQGLREVFEEAPMIVRTSRKVDSLREVSLLPLNTLSPPTPAVCDSPGWPHRSKSRGGRRGTWRSPPGPCSDLCPPR